MTTEVAVLNKFGIALAADSAVTVDHWHENRTHTKIYNTANKLFTLSKFEPIGFMYYNTVTLGGIPWETIVKVYRKHLGRTKHDTVERYAQEFFDWLNQGSIFSEPMVRDIVESAIIRAMVDLTSDKKSKAQFLTALNKQIDELKKTYYVPGFDDAFRDRVCKEYKTLIASCRKTCIRPSYSAGQSAKIAEYVSLVLTKQRQLSGYSGIVIAGFGDKEVLPRLREYTVDLVVLDRVRFWLKQENRIDEVNSSEVVPLADDEVITTLIDGISPDFVQNAFAGMISVILALPRKLLDPVRELTDAQKQQYIADAQKTLPQHFREFAANMRKHRLEKYTKPIKQAIASLSLSDLAMVAETFLGASQVLKRVRPEMETVGGPVDVAVISKGDGFVWIKRKLYFDEKYNPAFNLKYLEQ